MAAAWLRTPDLRFERPFITPEGLDLKIKLATAAQRATAFVIDGLIILSGLLAVVALSLLGGAMAGGLGHRLGQQAALVFITLGLFVWRNGYFIYFELGGRGATPGKRIMSIRVAARDGARLSAQAIFARNVLREVELMLPVTFLVLGASRPDAALFGAACLVWTGVLVFLPLMNRDRLRLGDMVAGTWVVRAPKPSLRFMVSGSCRCWSKSYGKTTRTPSERSPRGSGARSSGWPVQASAISIFWMRSTRRSVVPWRQVCCTAAAAVIRARRPNRKWPPRLEA